jgi:hypothetical protein
MSIQAIGQLNSAVYAQRPVSPVQSVSPVGRKISTPGSRGASVKNGARGYKKFISSPQSTSSNAVLAALVDLQTGG